MSEHEEIVSLCDYDDVDMLLEQIENDNYLRATRPDHPDDPAGRN